MNRFSAYPSFDSSFKSRFPASSFDIRGSQSCFGSGKTLLSSASCFGPGKSLLPDNRAIGRSFVDDIKVDLSWLPAKNTPSKRVDYSPLLPHFYLQKGFAEGFAKRQKAEKLFRGERNNNPGNIRFKEAIDWDGKLKRDLKIEPDFERFVTPHYGIRAIARSLKTNINGGENNTINKFIKKWAPDFENNTEAYQKAVSSSVAIGRDEVLQADEKTLTKLTKAIIHHENGRVLYSDAEITYAVKDAMKH